MMLLADATQEDMAAELKARELQRVRDNLVSWWELGAGGFRHGGKRYDTHAQAMNAGIEAIAGWSSAEFTVHQVWGPPEPEPVVVK